MERYRFHYDGSVFFVTFSVVEWLPVFVTEKAFTIVTKSLNFCHQKKGLRINAYVIMPTHFHAVVFHESFNADLLEQVLTEFRKFTGRQLSDFCDRNMPSCFSKTLRESAGPDRERQFWQASRHPVQIETESFWKTKFDYLHENPPRKGLVVRAVEWRFSSARYWLSEEKTPNDVILSALEW